MPGSEGGSGRRVVITGIGVVAPCGVGKEAFWEGLHQPATPGESLLVPDFDAGPWFDGPKEVRRADRVEQFARAAAGLALADGGDPASTDPMRRGVIIATGIGGLNTLESQVEVRLEKGERRVSPFLVPMIMANAGAASVSMRYGWQGPCETISTACAAGTHSLGYAARLIKWDRCDAVLAGGTESSITLTSMAGFRNMTALTSTGLSRPFDAERDGFVLSEGAAVLLLEELEVARARGAHIYGEILGSASTADAYHITAPSPGGAGAVACMEMAMMDAGLSPRDIVHVNAHGTSTSLNDAAEAEAIAKVFGSPGPIVTSTKGATGHPLGAAGAIEAAAVLLSMEHRSIPPTIGTTELDPEMSIDLVIGGPRAWEPGPTISNSFGFGGHNGTLVLTPF